MIPRILHRVRDRIDAWLYAHSTQAPAGHTSLLDELDGVYPMGEVPPLDLMRDAFNACPTCGWLPENGGHVLTHHPSGTPSGAHLVTYGEDPRVHIVAPAPFADWEETRAEAEWDNHVTDALAVVSPWNDADRASAAALGILL